MNLNWKIIGHEKILSFLEKSIATQKLSHAYLFYGPKGVGKNYLALRFAQILQCESEREKPCGHCIQCQQFKKNIHPDVYFVKKEEDKKNISINQIRELQRKLSLNSFTDSYKIALIDEAEILSEEAWDSLLKTLEEPTPKTIIILITSKIKKLPLTIISRSQVLRFNSISKQKILNYLSGDLKIEAGQAEVLAHLSFGRIGQAMNFIENPQSFIEYKDKAKDFLKILKSDFSARIKLIENYIGSKNKFLETVQAYQRILQIWELLIRDLALSKLNQDNLVNVFLEPELQKLRNLYDFDKLKNILQKIEKTREYLAFNVTPKLAMENLLLQM